MSDTQYMAYMRGEPVPEEKTPEQRREEQLAYLRERDGTTADWFAAPKQQTQPQALQPEKNPIKPAQAQPAATPAPRPAAASTRSSVDTDIPRGQRDGAKTFALIIANENYKREDKVPFAANDGKVFADYLRTTLGLPEKNIQFYADASLNDLRYGIDRLAQICRAFRGDASVIVYYAGHGIPDENKLDAHLLPVDGYGSNASTAYSLKDFYSALAEMPSKQTTVFLDACFSGAQRADGLMDSNARAVRIKPRPAAVGGNVVVIAATKDDQRAYPLERESHGLFTYYLLKKLRDSRGSVTLGELSDYIIRNVEQSSSVENERIQSPTVSASPALADWQSLKL